MTQQSAPDLEATTDEENITIFPVDPEDAEDVYTHWLTSDTWVRVGGEK